MSARDLAILSLEIAADVLSSLGYFGQFERPDLEAVLHATLGTREGDKAHRLALAAITVTRHWYAPHDFVTRNLEAAALLRDGWSPGDPVRSRNGGRRIW